MADHSDHPGEVGTLVSELLVAMQSQARTKLHPLMYVNMGLSLSLLLSVVFSAGILWQRVTELESRVAAIKNTDGMTAELSGVKEEVSRLRDRVDTLIDRQRGK